MDIISSLFGSDKVIDAGIDGIDAMVFTDEEKSKAKMAFLKLYEPYKLAQRWLMAFVCIPYVLAWSAVVGILILEVFTKQELNTDRLTAFLIGSDVGTAFVLIICFYFGGGAVEGVVRRFGRKK